MAIGNLSAQDILGGGIEICREFTSIDTNIVDICSLFLIKRNKLIYITIDFRSILNADSIMFQIPERFCPSSTVFGQINCTRLATINGIEVMHGYSFCSTNHCSLNTDGGIAQHFNSGETNKWTGTIRFCYLLD